MRGEKHFVGRKLRALREEARLSQAAFAERLGLSTSYLNQLENNQRPITATVLLALAQNFDVDIAAFSTNDRDRIVADLREALTDPAFAGEAIGLQDLKLVAENAPAVAHALLAVHRAYRIATDRLAEIDASVDSGTLAAEPSPYEEVRDFFHYIDNHVDSLDRAGERLARTLADAGGPTLAAAVAHLERVHGVRVEKAGPGDGGDEDGDGDGDTVRRFDPVGRVLTLGAASPATSHAFQLLHQIGLLEQADEIDRIVRGAQFRTPAADAICRIGLANYFAGAALMPYMAFLDAAKRTRHDLELLARDFGASLEQVAHRLSTLQRSGHKGVPFFFVRVDQAGNITKRHSATRLQFARFGASCPLWNVHRAFESHEPFIRQLAETPDGVRYISIAAPLTKPGGAFARPSRRYAMALGCEVRHAAGLVYADGLDIHNGRAYQPIGIGCRICERTDCTQRAVPPTSKPIRVEPDHRRIVPYVLDGGE